MVKAVDLLVVVIPGTAETKNLIGADVLADLGQNGILINIGRGSVVDERALIEALQRRTIRAAGLDVFADEPNVPAELIALDNVVLLPHVGSASVHTRDAMGQLMIDNLTNWFETGRAAHAGTRNPLATATEGKETHDPPPSVVLRCHADAGGGDRSGAHPVDRRLLVSRRRGERTGVQSRSS